MTSQKSAGGALYYTGEIAGQRVVVFPVNKKHERSPALRVLKSNAVPGGEAKSVTRPAPVTDDDIPF